jgi:hypothetical protein
MSALRLSSSRRDQRDGRGVSIACEESSTSACAGQMRLAHICASLNLVLFSAGSLVALGGDASLSVYAGAQSGRGDLPAAISLGVSALLALCMDVAMLYAASMLRLLGMRRAEPRSSGATRPPRRVACRLGLSARICASCARELDRTHNERILALRFVTRRAASTKPLVKESI